MHTTQLLITLNTSINTSNYWDYDSITILLNFNAYYYFLQRMYWARQYLNAERLIDDDVELSSYSDPPTLHVTPTTTNKCTATVWNAELPTDLGGMAKIIGPYSTTCDLHSSGEHAEPASMVCS